MLIVQYVITTKYNRYFVGYRGTSSVRPSERPSDGSSIPKSEMSIPMSQTDTRFTDAESRPRSSMRRPFRILTSKL